MTKLAAILYAYISLAIARQLIADKDDNLSFKVLLSWVILTPIVIFFPPGLLPVLFSGLVVFYLKPADPSDRVTYFLCVIPIVPEFFFQNISLGSINILDLNFWKLSIIVLLVPLFFAKQERKRRDQWDPVDYAVVFYFFYTSIMVFREYSFTSVLREMVNQFVLILAPYFVISRLLATEEAFNKCIKHLFYLIIIFSCVGLISTALQWDFYGLHDYLRGYYFRNGLLRINTTVNTASLATYMSIGLVIIEYFNSSAKTDTPDILKLGPIKTWLFRFLFLFVAFATGNRGGLLQCVLAPFLFHALFFFGPLARRSAIFLALLSIPSALIALESLDWEKFDEHGTFEYRYHILLATFEQIADYPVFGSQLYLEDGNFDHLVQGEGIIDIVNWYAEIVLEYGLMGLIPFMIIFFGTTLSLYKAFFKLKLSRNPAEKYVCAALLAILIPYLVTIGTTSSISFLPIQGLLLVSLSKAFLIRIRQQGFTR